MLPASLVSIFAVVFVYFGVPWIYGRYSRVLLKRKAIKSNALVLTFDDGPGHRLTPQLLNLLAEHKARATFFLLGRNIVGRESIVKQIEERGHEICSHGYEHIDYWKSSPLRALSDIKRGWETIDKALGRKQRMYPFRPPGGRLNLFCLLYLWFCRVPIYYWSLDTGDTRPVGKRDSQRAAILAGKTGGAVVLAHDFDRTTNDIDKMVLDCVRLSLWTAKEKGMKVMTLSELVMRNREI